MALEIQSLADVKVSNLKALIYGPPGVGKSTLAFSTDRCLALDFDRGSYRTPNPPDGVFVTNWAQQLGSLSRSDLAPYKTLVIDTVGTALDLLLADIMHENARLRQSNGAPTQQAYGVLLTRFDAFLKMVINAGVDVVMVAHATEHNDDGRLVQRIKATGQSRENVLQLSDLIGRLWIENGERRLSFDPKFASLGKNMGLADVVLPPTDKRPRLMSELMMDAKRYANSRNPDGVLYYRIIDVTSEPDDLLEALNDLVSDQSLPPVSEWSAECKRLLYARATEGQLHYDRATKRFSRPVAVAPADPFPADPDPDAITDDGGDEPLTVQTERERADPFPADPDPDAITDDGGDAPAGLF